MVVYVRSSSAEMNEKICALSKSDFSAQRKPTIGQNFAVPSPRHRLLYVTKTDEATDSHIFTAQGSLNLCRGGTGGPEYLGVF